MAVRPTPEMVSSGIAAMDALTGGLPRGCLTEICGPPSSGRTTVLLSSLAAATQRGECCAVVDAGDALDPQSVACSEIELERLLWVRCGETLPHKKLKASKSDLENRSEHRLEQLLRATDLLLESGGFGMIALDLCDLPTQIARRIPLTTWFRFRRAVEHTPTVLLVMESQSIAGSCSSLLVKLGARGEAHMSGNLIAAEANCSAGRILGSHAGPAHTQLLTQLDITAEIMRSRIERKPVRSAAITFASKTAWCG